MDYVAALHAENQRRLTALEDRSEEILVSLTEIAANTKDLPDLTKRVDNLESSRDKFGTGLKMVWVVLGVPTGTVMAWVGSHMNWSGLFH